MAGFAVSDLRRHPEIAAIVERRKAMGVDHLDEYWEGVLHMSPPPHGLHGECVLWAGQLLRTQATRYQLGRVTTEAGVREPGSGRGNYRVPDVSLIPLDYEYVDGWIENGALLAIEVRSPREEVLEKLDFYAARAILEVLHIDYREKRVSLFRREGKQFLGVTGDRDGWCELQTAALRLRRVEASGNPTLEAEDADARTGERLPSF